MSKELEALEKVIKHCDYQYCDEELYIIETALEDFNWLKSMINLTFLNSLSVPEDKMRVMKIMGVNYDTEEQ